MKKLISLLTISAFLFTLAPFQPVVAENGSDYPQVETLYAGKTIPVGTVTVSNDAENIYVKYEITEEGWCLIETHVHIKNFEDSFPTAGRTGNPVPGQFNYKEKHECLGDYEYEIPLVGDWEAGKELHIAAHAVVERYEQRCYLSETSFYEESIVLMSEIGDDVWGPIYNGSLENIDSIVDWGDVQSAVEAVNNISGSSWVWGKGNDYNPTYDPDIDDVKWISTAANTEVWNVDSWRLFQKEFEVPVGATNLEGLVIVNADNEYWAYFDGTQIGHDNDIWNELETHFFAPNIGNNILTFIVKNWGQSGSQVNNPNGLTYKASITYEMPHLECYDELVQTETAWAGREPFNKNGRGNWATWFEYTICESGVLDSENSFATQNPIGEYKNEMTATVLDCCGLPIEGFTMKDIQFEHGHTIRTLQGYQDDDRCWEVSNFGYEDGIYSWEMYREEGCDRPKTWTNWSLSVWFENDWVKIHDGDLFEIKD